MVVVKLSTSGGDDIITYEGKAATIQAVWNMHNYFLKVEYEDGESQSFDDSELNFKVVANIARHLGATPKTKIRYETKQ